VIPATSWAAVLLGCALCFASKIAGYIVPHQVLERPRVVRISSLLSVALLSALLAVQAFASGRHVVLDARAVALAVAAVALWLRAPFLVVVLLAGATAALLRALT